MKEKIEEYNKEAEKVLTRATKSSTSEEVWRDNIKRIKETTKKIKRFVKSLKQEKRNDQH